jgi:thiamine biosynthesis lipoprotein
MDGITRRDWLGVAAGLIVLPAARAAVERTQRHLFGSPIELLLPPGTPASARDDVLVGLATMNARWNAWKPGDLAELNAALRAGRTHRTTPALAAMMHEGARLEAASMGCFNPAIGALVGAWGFHDDVLRDGGAAPELTRWIEHPPSLAAHVELRGLDARSTHPWLQLDFGAYAKGVAIDWALDRLRRVHGLRDALLNLGGNLGAMGRVETRGWRVGIRDPHGPGLAASLATRGREAVVTSGSYERWRRLADGERAMHILDPATGRSASGVVSVTVVHPSAPLADAAATALLVAGPVRWRAIARRMGVDQVLVIDRAGRVEATPALAPRLNVPPVTAP